MKVHKIIRAGIRFETTDRKRAEARLREVQATAPAAKLITIQKGR